MNVKELRIGNYAKNVFGIIRIEEIPLKSNPLYNPDAIDPLPLTEEILLKVGFDNSGKTDMDCDWSYLIEFVQPWNVHNEKDSMALFESGVRGGQYTVLYNVHSESYTTIGVIKYVHQLQNLYFALTGTELIIEL